MIRKVFSSIRALLLLAIAGLAWAQECQEVAVTSGRDLPALTSCLKFQVPVATQVRLPVDLPAGDELVALITAEVREAEGQEEVEFQLCLLDSAGRRLQCRDAKEFVTLADLAPVDEGHQLLLRHHGDEPASVRLRLTTAERVLDEREPNDDLDRANTLVGGHGRGRSVGDENDYFVLEIEGEPRLWRLEATGSGLSILSYLDGSGSEVQRRYANGDSGRITMSNVLLLPGRHYLSVRGHDAAFEVSAMPLGPAGGGAERESNDDETRAEPLRFGEERFGILDPLDEDIYRFTFYAREHVRIELEPDEDLSPRFDLDHRLTVGDGGPAGEKLAYEALMLPGDHYLRIVGNGNGSGSYRLRLLALDPLDLPADLEPNDREYQARPLPDTLHFEGSLASHDTWDWFLLPRLKSPVRASLAGEGDVVATLYRFEGATSHQLEYFREMEAGITVELPADEDLRIALSGTGPYRLALDFGLPAVEPAADIALSLEVPGEPAAAYWHEGQTIEASVLVQNRSQEAREVELLAVSSHYGWRPILLEERLYLAPLESRTVPLVVELLPDARDDLGVRVTVQALPAARQEEVEEGSAKIAIALPYRLSPAQFKKGERLSRDGPTASAALVARCGAPPLSPSLLWSLPDSLLGGINLAWEGLGADIVDRQRNYAAAQLIDGMVAPSSGWRGTFGRGVTISLARSDVPLAGVTLNPYASRSSGEGLADFELLASQDGEVFETVLRGRLGPEPVEQAFVFERVFTASHLRIVPLSNQAGDDSGFVLGELKVIARPEKPLFLGEGVDIAARGTGGYLVWSKPHFKHGPTFLNAGGEAQTVYLERDETVIEWAVGFHHDRAGKIAALKWTTAPAAADVLELPELEVAVSLESPAGPWRTVASWDPKRQPELPLQEVPWARFIRFRAQGLQERSQYALPLRLEVREPAVDGTYRSVIGEWGQNNRQAIFELLEQGAEGVALSEEDGNDDPEHAQPLPAGRSLQGRVLVGEDEDWYRLTVPEGDNFLRLRIDAEPLLTARFELLTAAGNPVLHDLSGTPARLELTAFVEPGDYFLRIDEPPRSVVFAWDNSGSMGEYLDIIYQTVSGFVAEVQPGREVAQLLAFEDDPKGVFLLPDWSDQPFELMTALNDFDRAAGSSDAESNLLASTRALGEREGTKAILLMTDAESPGARLTPELWSELERVRPRIFTFETSSAGSAHTQDLMQSWADVAGGHYDYARGVGDFEAGFARATCHLRRPAHYRLEAATAFREPPGPGLLSVVREAGVAGNPPVEVILDLSGSMAKALPEGPSRVEVAKRVLGGLVEEVLPEGTPFALRLFGHIKPNSCDTRLEMRLAPLDREATRRVITLAQPQLLSGTPLAASLLEVPADLEGRDGATVILLTDGEESCGGDVEAAVTALSAAGIDVRLHIISFDVESEEAKAAFADWARLGGGRFFGTSDEAGLAAALRSALAPEFEVIDGTGSVVARGTVGGPPLTLPPGIYQVRVQGSGDTTFAEVRVRGDDEQQLVLGGDGR